jgi:hypothetical protein
LQLNFSRSADEAVLSSRILSAGWFSALSVEAHTHLDGAAAEIHPSISVVTDGSTRRYGVSLGPERAIAGVTDLASSGEWFCRIEWSTHEASRYT